MTAHPNRNWRRRAIDAYQRFRRDQAGQNYPAPDTVEDKIQRAYMTGYSDGRLDKPRINHD